MRRRCGLVALAVAVLLLGGCGGQSPGEAVPALAEGVAQVDRAVAAGDRPAAREALDALVSEAEQAVTDGDLSQDDAAAVVAAAEALLTELGQPATAEPSPDAQHTTAPEESSGEDAGEGEPDAEEGESDGEAGGGSDHGHGKPDHGGKPGKGPKKDKH